MILYAVVALGDLGITVHIYFNDADVLVLALCRVLELSAESVVMIGTGAKLNSSLSVMLWVMTSQAALPGFHALTGADITAHRENENLKHILDLTFYGYFNTTWLV